MKFLKHNKDFALITSYYVSDNEERNAENLLCLKMNLLNPLIKRVLLVLESEKKPIIKLDLLRENLDKIEFVLLGKRPTFQDFIKQANSVIREGYISIIANSDLYFDETLITINKHLGSSIFALTRWDLMADDSIVFYNNYKSQDVWIFAKTIDESIGNYYQGKPGCDNRFLFELKERGYKLRNPSLSLHSIHVHSSKFRPYEAESDRHRVNPPYAYILPEGYYSPLVLCFLNMFSHLNFERYKFSLKDYYSVRYRYYRSVWKNNLEAHHFNFFQRLVSCLFMFYSARMLKITTVIKIK